MRALSLLFLAISASAQPVYEIRGRVMDGGGSPIPGATVTVGGVDRTNIELTTDASGEFRTPVTGPGIYVSSARKDGYFPGVIPGAAPVPNVTLDSGRTQGTFSLTLIRAAEISGRLLDEETRQPLPDTRVHLIARMWSRGRMMLQRGAVESTVKTDADGNFRFTNLPPQVEYLVSPHEPPSAPSRYLPNATEGDFELEDEAYAATYWPGGSLDAATAQAVALSAGFGNIGNVYARRIRQFRVRITLGSCNGSSRVSLIDANASDISPIGVFPCGSSFLLKALDPGPYVLHAGPDPTSGAIPEALPWGELKFEITDRNLNLLLALQSGTVVQGQVIVAEGVRPPTTTPSIILRPVEALANVPMPPETFLLWDEDQRHFRIAISPLPQNLEVMPFGGELSLKEIRWNGAPLREGPIFGSGGAGRLEIYLDDKITTLNVSVTDGTRPVSSAIVLAVRPGVQLSQVGGVSGADGRATIRRLAPGEYRLIAIPAGQQAALNPPAVFDRLLSTAPRVTITPGGTYSIDVRLADLR